MQISNKTKEYNAVVNLLHGRRVIDAIGELRSMVKKSQKEYINERLDGHALTYKNILKHTFSAVKDPEREKVYGYLIKNLLELADELNELLLTETQSKYTYRLKNELLRYPRLEITEVDSFISSITHDDRLSKTLEELNLGLSSGLSQRQQTIVKVFRIIWLTDRYGEAEVKLMEKICDSNVLPSHDKSLFVSALTIGLLRYFDVSKFLALFRFIQTKEETVWERALVGLFVAFLKYNERAYLYPNLEDRIKILAKTEGVDKHIEAIVIQFIKARETDTIKHRWEEEVLPEMMKMQPRIEEKLRLDDIFKDEFGEEKNPDWENVFEDSPGLLDKLAEFTEMQMEGMDIFISAFSKLKNFPFFVEISNWLVPFYIENEAISSLRGSDGGQTDLSPLIDKLEKTFFMCNGDKYSFCLNLAMVPESQKAMMMNMIKNEMASFEEIEKNEGILDQLSASKKLYTQYFQDLYRFFRLHPWRGEFDDIFSFEIDLYENILARNLLSEQKTIRNIGELFFDKKFYSNSLKIFLSILENEKSNIELFEKVAFCYEKIGNLEKALDNYLKADLIDSDRPWILRKLAFCCKYLNRWEDALKYYRTIEKIEPEDLKVQANIGQCLVHLEDYQQALDYYFKVEVLAPENQRIRRPLAWCSFALGKFDVAADYLQRLLAVEPNNAHDLLNLAHVRWCMGKPMEALEIYKESLKAIESFDAFKESFSADRHLLQKHGIYPYEMDLMLDYIRVS